MHQTKFFNCFNSFSTVSKSCFKLSLQQNIVHCDYSIFKKIYFSLLSLLLLTYSHFLSPQSKELVKAYPPFVNFFEMSKETIVRCEKQKPRFHAFLKVWLLQIFIVYVSLPPLLSTIRYLLHKNMQLFQKTWKHYQLQVTVQLNVDLSVFILVKKWPTLLCSNAVISKRF